MDALTTAAYDPSPDVRVAALQSIGVAQTSTALAALTAALDSTDSAIRKAAVEGLIKLARASLRPDTSEPALAQAAIERLCRVSGEDPDPRVGAAAQEGLSWIDERDSLEASE